MPGLAAPAAPSPLPSGGSFINVGSMTSGRLGHTATLLGNGKVLIAGGFTGTGSATTNTAELFDPAAGTFTSANSMSLARSGHTATLLPSGKVLIAGGFTGTAITDTAELFDPASRTFTLIPNSMSLPRDGHTATLLRSGKVLIAGGRSGTTTTNTAELFDPASGTFTSLSPNTMSLPRVSHTATLLPSGMVLITGGDPPPSGEPTNTAELFDPASGTFTLLPKTMASLRDSHTATLLPNGKVLIAGGYPHTGIGQVGSNTAELFDPSSGNFTLLPVMTSPRQGHTATLLSSGKVLIAGGNTVSPTTPTNTAELFDPASGTFTSLLPNTMTSARVQHTATLLPSGRVLIAGGSPGGSGPANTAELFDSSSGSFTAGTNMNVARFFPTATLLPSGKVLITGGQPGTGPANTAELFDPSSGSFALLPNTMQVGRFRHTATLLLNGKVLIAGGDTSSVGTGATDSAELFDPNSQTFTSLSPMTSPRWSHTATLLSNGKVLLTGGIATANFAVTNSAELFDPATNTFTAVSPMNSARDFHTATLLENGKVLIAGGFTPTTGGLNTAELFDPGSGTFTLVSNVMTTKRYYHSATLLPNGKVLIAGGGGSAPPVFSGSVITNTAELFDPIAATFTLVPNTMNSYRYWQTATLLPSGKVLLADGSTIDFAGAEYTRTAELFDPATQTFTLLPLMNSVRFGHTATLLPSGKVLIAAGTTGSTATNTTELFDEGLGFSDARRPVLSTATNPLAQPASLVLTGTGFRGDSEASGSSCNNSATNYPLLQLQRIDNDQTFFALSDPATNWSDTTFTSATLGAMTPLPTGYYRVTIFTNAIPSLQKIINIGTPPLQLVSVVSRMTHGSITNPPYFEVSFPLTGTRGVECRSSASLGAGNYTLVFTFTNNLTSVGSATVSSHDPTTGTGTVSSSAIGPNPNQYTVNLTGVSTGQYITVTLNSVVDATGASGNVLSPQMGFLVGDVNANGVVTNADVSLVKSQIAAGASVDSSNFRNDINTNGIITGADRSLTKAQVAAGAQLPTPP